MSTLNRYPPGEYIYRGNTTKKINKYEKFTIVSGPDVFKKYRVILRGVECFTRLESLVNCHALRYDLLTEREKFEYELSGRLPERWRVS